MQSRNGTLPAAEVFPVLTFFMRLPAVHKKKMNKSLCRSAPTSAGTIKVFFFREICGTINISVISRRPTP